MSLGGRDPFEEIEDLLERMGRQLERDGWPAGGAIEVDVADHGDRFVVTADLPGYEKADIEVQFAAGALQLDAERDLEDDGDEVDYLRRERRREPVSRTITLPEPVDESDLSATYANGVLRVELPKQASDAGTSIDID